MNRHLLGPAPQWKAPEIDIVYATFLFYAMTSQADMEPVGEKGEATSLHKLT